MSNVVDLKRDKLYYSDQLRGKEAHCEQSNDDLAKSIEVTNGF
jgi:hypothetical protein